MEKQGRLFDAEARFPELYHPPGYPLVIAGALAVLPAELRHRLFAEVPDPPNGFGGDYLLLVLNGLLLGVAAWQSWCLGRRLFDARNAMMKDDAGIAVVPWWDENDTQFKALLVAPSPTEVAFGPTPQNMAIGDEAFFGL
ncbi:MAG: hypothetical protein QNL51_12455 [Opitutaceae bacterium]|tara:strand:+ start:16263 stop:16682 length:420 start_codon:yes stop_codon:yes gene_type:complete